MYVLLLLVDTAVGERMKKALVGGQMKELVDPYLLFAFAGKEVRIKKQTLSLLDSCFGPFPS